MSQDMGLPYFKDRGSLEGFWFYWAYENMAKLSKLFLFKMNKYSSLIVFDKYDFYTFFGPSKVNLVVNLIRLLFNLVKNWLS